MPPGIFGLPQENCYSDLPTVARIMIPSSVNAAAIWPIKPRHWMHGEHVLCAQLPNKTIEHRRLRTIFSPRNLTFSAGKQPRRAERLARLAAMALTLRNRISIAQICFYAPTLLVGTLLFFRHGFGRNAAWFFLAGFCAIRMGSSALQLATMDDPMSVSINTGAIILQNVGISPLMLVLMGLLGRVLASLRKEGSRRIPLHPMVLRAVQLIILVGLVFAIVGGVKAGDEFKKTFQFNLPVEGKWGLSFIIAGYGLLVFSTVLVAYYTRTHINSEDRRGRERLVLTIVLSLPFILVRIVYSCLATFTTNSKFNQLTGDDHYFLGMAVMMEIFVITICAAIGGSLPKDALHNENEIMHRFMGKVRGEKESAMMSGNESTRPGSMEAACPARPCPGEGP
ncbi:hypothetical protein MKZ38_002786 [Zalerion maritima]|uniref:DUF7702 domain-containing protein n=1 Tax=Zalerion maritima TaxID=339359 RepID=A0AAD5WST5_9PEZI|nr:hypothetical protein MKZ38_002786 [Zalerion maritima]